VGNLSSQNTTSFQANQVSKGVGGGHKVSIRKVEMVDAWTQTSDLEEGEVESMLSPISWAPTMITKDIYTQSTPYQAHQKQQTSGTMTTGNYKEQSVGPVNTAVTTINTVIKNQ